MPRLRQLCNSLPMKRKAFAWTSPHTTCTVSHALWSVHTLLQCLHQSNHPRAPVLVKGQGAREPALVQELEMVQAKELALGQGLELVMEANCKHIQPQHRKWL